VIAVLIPGKPVRERGADAEDFLDAANVGGRDRRRRLTASPNQGAPAAGGGSGEGADGDRTRSTAVGPGSYLLDGNNINLASRHTSI
jgi:hypothetical protein